MGEFHFLSDPAANHCGTWSCDRWLGAACAIIAEPEKRGPRDERQGGLVGNFICFPQAKVGWISDRTSGSARQPPDF